MTIGQRIAQKRKEQALSQEALGQTLGVSRQSIYKWESDTALPEIDKLIALSRLFGVSVGWLLGVEDGADMPKSNTDELNETQLKMVQEIVDRYLASQPKPDPRKKWPWVLAALILIGVFFTLFNRLSQLNYQYNNLQNSVYHIDQNVSQQIGGISNQVEAILKQQNNLTAEYGSEHLSTDCKANTASFRVWAVPRTYVDGMTATFTADCGTGITEAAANASSERKFTAELTSELTDSITLSVVFTYPDGTRQTQMLDTHYDLFTETMPFGDVEEDFMYMKLSGSNKVTIPPRNDPHTYYAYIHPDTCERFELVSDIRVGVFKNQTLLAWAEPCDVPADHVGFDNCRFFAIPALETPMAAGNELCCAAVVTDVYGRTTIFPGMIYVVDEDRGELTWADNQSWDIDPVNWNYD